MNLEKSILTYFGQRREFVSTIGFPLSLWQKVKEYYENQDHGISSNSHHNKESEPLIFEDEVIDLAMQPAESTSPFPISDPHLLEQLLTKHFS